MEKDLSFVLLIIAGLALVILFVFSLKTRVRPSRVDGNDEDFSTLLEEDLGTFSENDVVEIEPSAYQTYEAPQPEEVVVRTKNDLDAAKIIKPEINKPAQPQPAAMEKIIVLHILPHSGRKFQGQEIWKSLTANQMNFGAMSIFHRYETIGEDVKVLFSLAQATEPGTFDVDAMPEAYYQGLTMFMQLSGSEHNLKTYELFIQTAQQIADDLRGVIVDKHKDALTADSTRRFKNLVQLHLNALK